MAKQTIGIGSAANDGTGDPLRNAFDKCNDNFDELYLRTATSTSDPTVNDDSGDGYQVGSLWVNTATGRVFVARSVSLAAAVWVPISPEAYLPYIPTFYYIPLGVHTLNSGAAAAANLIRFTPGYFKSKVTIDRLGVRVTTLSVGGNVQLAVYANNIATLRPTGNALASTGSLSTTTAVSVEGAASATFEANTLYWFAVNCDNAVATVTSASNLSTWTAAHVGSATQSANLGNNTTGQTGLSYAGTFGVWPDFTALSCSETTGSLTNPVVQFRVASVP